MDNDYQKIADKEQARTNEEKISFILDEVRELKVKLEEAVKKIELVKDIIEKKVTKK